ncbi:ankyrin repeat domain-containing protein [Micromonospora sp. DT46]|uniref:ankyrin repeat domain-containing protein n=1 Tax=Micromonospora sp. DT46 TaxID=3393435 RepID=UPI003CED7FE4
MAARRRCAPGVPGRSRCRRRSAGSGRTSSPARSTATPKGYSPCSPTGSTRSCATTRVARWHTGCPGSTTTGCSRRSPRPGSTSTHPTRDGHTPLHAAALTLATEVMEVLLAAGADPDAVDERGRTAAEVLAFARTLTRR